MNVSKRISQVAGRYPKWRALFSELLFASWRSLVFLRFGVFDASWYRKMYPDIRSNHLVALLHYSLFGWKERRNPCPYFDVRWYIENNKDVAKSGMEPLYHYLIWGWKECRNPSPLFDTQSYQLRFMDGDSGTVNPLVHLKRCGKREDNVYCRTPDVGKIAFSIADERDDVQLPDHYYVNVIIPVYAGIAETKRCIESVLNAVVDIDYRLLVINDASPDAGMDAMLQELAKKNHSVKVLTNEQNVGFVVTVNLGMTYDAAHDVILLNSDTVVDDGWIDRLVAHAYSQRDVGTVTPLSNNATICSYPTIGYSGELPEGESLKSMNRHCMTANRGRNVEIPTAVGFCMMIRRDCLNEAGLFDVEAFGKGYGEENDFCMRAGQMGWKHLLACDMFVYHKGELSFGKSGSDRKSTAQQIMQTRWPSYNASIQRFVANDPALEFNIAITARRYVESGKPVILFVSHSLGGGISRHIDDVLCAVAGRAHCLVMTPMQSSGNDLWVFVRFVEGLATREIRLSLRASSSVELLRILGVTRIHIHSVIGYGVHFRRFIREINIPFDFTVHDYYALCPKIFMMRDAQNYCEEPGPMGCLDCLCDSAVVVNTDVLYWRACKRWVLTEAESVICPSKDVASRIMEYEPEANVRVVYHEKDSACDKVHPVVVPHVKDDFLRIVVIGAMSKHKGYELLNVLAKRFMQDGLLFKIILLGECEIDDEVPVFEYTGRYEEAELSELIAQVNPHLLFYPSRAPETYSYTLSAGMKSGRPILAPAIGAFSERLKGRPWTWMYGVHDNADDIISSMQRIRSQFCAQEYQPTQKHEEPKNDCGQLYDFRYYTDQYLKACGAVSVDLDVRDLRRTGQLTILVVLECFPNGEPKPCAYIRVLLPLRAKFSQKKVQVVPVRSGEALFYKADLLITHRTAIDSEEEAKELINHCRNSRMPLVYDIDDDLLHLPSDHPSYPFISKYTETIKLLLSEATEVWVSTVELKRRLGSYNEHVVHMPNVLDRNLWHIGDEVSLSSEPVSDSARPLRIVYMGTATHDDDFAMVVPALKKLKRLMGKRISIHLIGVKTSRPFRGCQIEALPFRSENYPTFVHWVIKQRGCFDIGIAPLVSTAFNKAKSEIKFYDYTALGCVTVASDIEGYAEVIKNGENGVLVGSKDAEWYDVLYSLCMDSRRRTHLLLGAQNTLTSHKSCWLTRCVDLVSANELP